MPEDRLTRDAMASRRLVQAGIPDNIVSQCNNIRSLIKWNTAPEAPFTLNEQPGNTATGKLIIAAQQCARTIINSGGQAYGASYRDAEQGNMTFSEFASLAKQNAAGEWAIDVSSGMPYPVNSEVCRAYAQTLTRTGFFGLGRKGQDKKGADLDKAVSKLDFTTLANGGNAAGALDTVLKLCYEGIQNVPQETSQKLNNALNIVAQNVQKDNQTPDKKYVQSFVSWCINNPQSYTMAWLKQSFPNPAQAFKDALGMAKTQAAAQTAAQAVVIK